MNIWSSSQESNISINVKLKWICASVCVKFSRRMILKLIVVLLISSVVIASESSCDNVGNVTAKDAKYLKFNGGFFYM